MIGRNFSMLKLERFTCLSSEFLHLIYDAGHNIPKISITLLHCFHQKIWSFAMRFPAMFHHLSAAQSYFIQPRNTRSHTTQTLTFKMFLSFMPGISNRNNNNKLPTGIQCIRCVRLAGFDVTKHTLVHHCTRFDAAKRLYSDKSELASECIRMTRKKNIRKY